MAWCYQQRRTLCQRNEPALFNVFQRCFRDVLRKVLESQTLDAQGSALSLVSMSYPPTARAQRGGRWCQWCPGNAVCDMCCGRYGLVEATTQALHLSSRSMDSPGEPRTVRRRVLHPL